jgi:hypothetical protein
MTTQMQTPDTEIAIATPTITASQILTMFVVEHSTRSNLTMLAWRQRLHDLSLTFENNVLLSRFDLQEVNALNLDPSTVISAFEEYRAQNISRYPNATLDDMIYAFRQDFLDGPISQVSSELRGTFRTLSEAKVSNQTIIAAIFGEQEARIEIQSALGERYATQYISFVKASDRSIISHTETFGYTAIPELVLMTSVEAEIKRIFAELERLLRELEAELQRSINEISQTNIVSLVEYLKSLQNRFDLDFTHNQQLTLQRISQ